MSPERAEVYGQGLPFHGVRLNGVAVRKGTIYTVSHETELEAGILALDLVQKFQELFNIIE